MTKEELEELIKQEENPKLDFKRDYEEKKENTEYISDIVSIANGNIDNIGETGYLIFGIQEKPREIYGVETNKELQDIKRHLAEKLNNHVSPHIKNIDVKDFYFNSKRVIVVIIPFQESILILKKDVKQTRYKASNFLYRIGDGIQFISNAYDSKSVDDFKIKIDEYKEKEKNRQKAKELKSLKLFKPKKEINEEKGLYINQKNTVKVSALLPIISNVEESRFSIECEITIILENSNKIIIDISEKETLENLFSGYKSIIKGKKNNRNWIISFDEKSKLYTISLSSIILNVSHITVELLSEFLDDLQINYAKRLNNIEERLNSKEFPFSKEYKNGFELCQISLKLWNDIQKFSLNHLVDKGKGDWYIFGDYNKYNQVVVLDRPIHIDKIFKYKIENSLFSKITNPKITIIWDTLSTNYSANIRKKNFSSVSESYNWFVNKFIPQIIKESQKEKIKNNKFAFFNKKKVSDLKLTKDDFDSFKSDKDDINNLLVIVDKLANFFCIKDISISRDILKDLYKGLILLFWESENLAYGYLSEKFFWIGEKTDLEKDYFYFNSKEEFISKIKKELIKIEENKIPIDNLINEYTIEHIFKCYYIIIRDNFDSYSDTFIYDVKENLREVIEIYNILKVRERRLNYI